MLTRYIIVGLAAVVMAGCDQEAPDPNAGLTVTQRLENASKIIRSDPNASPLAKQIANGAMTKVKDQDDINDFEKGR